MRLYELISPVKTMYRHRLIHPNGKVVVAVPFLLLLNRNTYRRVLDCKRVTHSKFQNTGRISLCSSTGNRAKKGFLMISWVGVNLRSTLLNTSEDRKVIVSSPA